ncbi:hypothetical protein [Arsenicibacter rosenii]|uniref:CMP/dCMP-type deaminase domain-containing protein n=1 Tax=Arsenicibacter rosenii TaxID=1750698 RepID=A0A1S2VQZ4_9BACT|nr:hypothetical protein [Arsenicibacter rosenii]OIN61207.1 hypothetical protein BLX24_03865 [Arsenicibacter rosenii]
MNTPLDNLYKIREELFIIGLTGRLGSGCTSVANLLTKEKFSECNFPFPETINFKSNEARKYRIIYNYMEKNWKPFILIRPSDIITAILLETSLEELINDMATYYDKDKGEITKIFDIGYKNGFRLKDEFERLQKIRTDIQSLDDKDSKEEKKDRAYEFYINDSSLHIFSEKLKVILRTHLTSENKASAFQYFGDNIRQYGYAIIKDKPADDCLKIPKIIDKLIETIKSKNKAIGKPTWIVIDSIRNSLEAFFFKEHYSSFYLLAVNTENNFRRGRLNSSFTNKQLDQLDQEYDASLKPLQQFYKQDIKSCIQASDIYLYNPNDPSEGGDTFTTLKKSLIRYLALILQPGIITPTPEERCMQIAYTAKYNSGCISRQVGAVVTDSSFSIKYVGWNNTAEGQTPCLLRNVDDLLTNTDNEAFSQYEKTGKVKDLLKEAYSDSNIPNRKKKLSGRNTSFCFKEGQNCLENDKNQVHTRALHAEENAMLQISKYGGEGLREGILFSTASPCELCSKKAYQLGISQIYYIDPYPGIAKEQILEVGPIKHQPTLQLFSGAIGRAYHHLFHPFMGYKDELSIRLGYSYSNALDNIIKQDEDLKQKKIKKLNEQKEEIEKKIAELSK